MGQANTREERYGVLALGMTEDEMKMVSSTVFSMINKKNHIRLNILVYDIDMAKKGIFGRYDVKSIIKGRIDREKEDHLISIQNMSRVRGLMQGKPIKPIQKKKGIFQKVREFLFGEKFPTI